MKALRFWPILLLAPLAFGMSISTARAATVLYNDVSVVQGQEGFVESFSVSTPGMLTFSVSNVPWLDVVADLNCFLSTSTGVVGTTMKAVGSESVSIGPGTYYAHWFGEAQGTYGAGVLSINIQFQPAGTVVPLPSSLILMLSGLGLLVAWQRRRTTILA